MSKGRFKIEFDDMAAVEDLQRKFRTLGLAELIKKSFALSIFILDLHDKKRLYSKGEDGTFKEIAITGV